MEDGMDLNRLVALAAELTKDEYDDLDNVQVPVLVRVEDEGVICLRDIKSHEIRRTYDKKSNLIGAKFILNTTNNEAANE